MKDLESLIAVINSALSVHRSIQSVHKTQYGEGVIDGLEVALTAAKSLLELQQPKPKLAAQ